MIDQTLQSIRERMAQISEELAVYLIQTATVFIGSPQDSRNLFMGRLALEEREHFDVAFLNNRHELIAVERLFSGTIDGASIHVRIIIQRAMALNAAAIMIAHNHPSGNPEPSTADKVLTKTIIDACSMVDVRVIDHIIVAKDRAHSFAEHGQL